MLPTDLTVSAVVERDGHFLMIEERSSGRIVLNQPGGHIKAGEAPEEAIERETLEEAGCVISVGDLLGVYLWIHPQTRQNFLRIAYAAELLADDPRRRLDDGIVAVHWYTMSDIKLRQKVHRSPMVLRTVEDYLSGERQPVGLLAKMQPLQSNVDQVLANAALV